MDAPPSSVDGTRGPWWWVPSLYFAQALPNALVVNVSVYAYTRLGVSAETIGATALLSLPWMLKPLWSPLVELFGTERRWIWTMQFLAAAALAVVALGYERENFLLWTVVGYGLLAVASATHDIAADGYYMRALSAHDQTWFAGLRNVFFRVGVIFGEGFLLWLAGKLMLRAFEPQLAWTITHGLTAGVMLLLGLYHLAMLPTLAPKIRPIGASALGVVRESLDMFRKFFAAIPIGVALSYILLYRFAEAQLAKFAGKFLLDPRSVGGLEMLEGELGWINGFFGVGALLAGGVLGGIVAARYGLRACLWPMALLINVPNIIYVLLAVYQPTSLTVIGIGVVIEKFGYGFGFTGYMLYLLYIARGEYRTAFYAICTGFMTLGLILPQYLAGHLLTRLTYTQFFLWVLVATIPSFIVTWVVWRGLNPRFGLKEESA